MSLYYTDLYSYKQTEMKEKEPTSCEKNSKLSLLQYVK